MIRKLLSYTSRSAFAMVLSIAFTPALAQTAVEYIHTDALGSPVAVTDASGNVIEREIYEPYGSPITRPPSDQPGFTGHVGDSLTNLTYMQQRYYDPQIGRFLSVDPVTAYSNPVGAFNRYWYANNNPYRFTDPDGREVAYTYGQGISKLDGRMFMVSVTGLSQTSHSDIRQLEKSGQKYTILIDNKATPGYDANTRTLRLNPTYGFRIKSSGEVQSPKVNSAHEISHAAQHDRVGDEAFGKALERPTNADGTIGVSREENRATEVEQRVGKELGEPTRKDYRDAGERVDCNPKAGSGC